ncbi:hypothetical protein Hanom_Chr07g00619101 [Helianthus anomalus]
MFLLLLMEHHPIGDVNALMMDVCINLRAVSENDKKNLGPVRDKNFGPLSYNIN